jgi:hypothetical protein
VDSIDDAFSERGLEPFGLDGPMRWRRPKRIQERDGQLTWVVDGDEVMTRTGHKYDPFFDFLDLANVKASDAPTAVLRYARRWGPLHLCARHGLPSSHTGTWLISADTRSCSPRRRGPDYIEPIARWIEFAAEAQSILLARADWSLTTKPPHLVAPTGGGGIAVPGQGPIDPAATRRTRKAGSLHGRTGVIGEGLVVLPPSTAIAIAVRRWLALGAVYPLVRSQGPDFTLGFQADNLFGALALRLAGDLQNARPLVRCEFCGVLYRQTRLGTFCCDDPECHRLRRNRNARKSKANNPRKTASQKKT